MANLSTQRSETFHNGALVDSSTKHTPMPFAGAMDKTKDYLSNNPKALAMLIGGAGSGLVGGYLSSRVPKGPNESKGGRRLRILRNALLAAGAGAGATGLAMTGADELNTALPVDDVDPATSLMTGSIPRTLAVGGVGAGLLNHGKAEEAKVRRGVLAGAGKTLEKSNPTTSARIGDSLNIFNRKGEGLRERMYHDIMSGAEDGSIKGLNTKDLLKNRVEAGGLSTYDPTTIQHWMSRLGRFKNRLVGSKFGPKALTAGAGLTAAALSPDIIQGLLSGATGSSNK